MTSLFVSDRPGDGPPILALHGATSTHHFWSPVAAALPGRRFIAPDLRGRGRSAELGGPYGVPAHVADLLTLLEDLDLRDVVLTGHSMGAFIAPLLALRAPGRIKRVVLLDGGLPVALPFFFIRPVVGAVFRAQAKRLAGAGAAMRGLDPMISNHPEVAAEVAGWIDASLENGVYPFDRACLPVDSVSCFFDQQMRVAAAALDVPVDFLYAEWGRGDGKGPFYSRAQVDKVTNRSPHISARLVPGTNHLTLLFAPEVAAAISS